MRSFTLLFETLLFEYFTACIFLFLFQYSLFLNYSLQNFSSNFTPKSHSKNFTPKSHSKSSLQHSTPILHSNTPLHTIHYAISLTPVSIFWFIQLAKKVMTLKIIQWTSEITGNHTLIKFFYTMGSERDKFP